MKKWIILILISLVILAISLAFNIRNNYKFVEVEDSTRQTYINHLNKQVRFGGYKETRQEIRAMLEEELGFRHYIYTEGKVDTGGRAVAMYRVIEMDKDIDIEQYCIVLCHEMCHIKYFTANEIYTQFMAFKSLYESDNPTLKSVGAWFGIYVLDRHYVTEYDCSQLIIDYLEEKTNG